MGKALVTLAVVLGTLAGAAPARAETYPAATRIVVIEDDSETFRAQLLAFVQDMDDALVLALEHPAIGPSLAASMESRSVQIPLPPEVYAAIERASVDELDRMRSGMAAVPGAFEAPQLLRLGLASLPPMPAAARSAQAACSDVYSEFSTIQSLTEAQRGVTIAKNVIGLLVGIFKLIKDTNNTFLSVCESPIDVPTSWSQIPSIIILGVVELVSLALDLTVDELGFSVVDADRCIHLTNCPRQGFSERFRPDEAPTLLGRGCDERDNNCTGGIDETAEDLFRPAVGIDAAFTARCYRSEDDARAAARLAVRAEDDCVGLSEATQPPDYQGRLDVQFSRAGCFGTLMVMASDKHNNSSGASAMVTIDDTPPVIALNDLSASCQPTVDAARNAFGLSATDACSNPEADVRVVEKECVADFEFDAVDDCGNRTVERRSVRIDGAAPAVDIERLQLPAFDGRVCFASEAQAIAEVAEATRYRDNCSPTPDLTFLTGATPIGANACDREMRSTVTDRCGLADSDALSVRLDGTAPTIQCSVATTILDPPDGRWVDVELALTVGDDCGAADVKVDVAVTSDEPTSFQLDVKGEDDGAPDARVQIGPDGRPVVQLRAERQQTESADGRVYRIRATATDACGNRSHADCYVVVPKVQQANRSDVVNSGQNFDATARN